MTTSGVRTRASRKRRPLPPRVWPFRPADFTAIVAFNAVIIIAMWFRHGGMGAAGGVSGIFTALGQITALLGTYAALIQIVLMSRSPWIEQLFGMDRLAHWHRWLGFAFTTLIIGHVAFTTIGYAAGDHVTFATETWRLLTRYPDMLAAAAGTVLIVMIAITSMRWARKKLSYEAWHMLHLYAYLAMALAFAHQFAAGSDFSGDGWSRGYWIALYVVVIAAVLASRVIHPLLLNLRHRLRVADVRVEGPGVVSVYITGRNIHQLRTRAGQYFKWRFITGRNGWPAHPFSLSAAPNGEYLRLTVKESGDGSSRVQGLRKGTRVAIEGPYGTFTYRRRTRPGVLLIAGGIGIAPIRALVEELPSAGGDAILLYRASSWENVIFRDELVELMRARRGHVYYFVGPRSAMDEDPLSPAAISRIAPDVSRRDVFICGPAGMMAELHDTLNALGVPDRQIHYERFALL